MPGGKLLVGRLDTVDHVLVYLSWQKKIRGLGITKFKLTMSQVWMDAAYSPATTVFPLGSFDYWCN
jgi:hypothetical protein